MHPGAEIVSRTVEGPIHRCTYGDIHRRVEAGRERAGARSASKPGDRIAHARVERLPAHGALLTACPAWARCCTRSTRGSFPSRSPTSSTTPRTGTCSSTLTFAPLVEKLAPQLQVGQGLRRDDRSRAHAGARRAEPALLRGAGSARGDRLRVAGVRRAHRVVAVLHVRARRAIRRACCTRIARRCCTRTPRAWSTDLGAVVGARSVLLVVPMFHVNAWGMPYAGAMSGAKLVLPGPALDGKSVYALMKDEQVTLALGVPTGLARCCSSTSMQQALDPQARPRAEARGHRRLGRAARDERAASRRSSARSSSTRGA